MVASVLATTGELARVAGPGLRPHICEVLPLIIDAIQDAASGNKRVVAVECLGQARALPPRGRLSPPCASGRDACRTRAGLGAAGAGIGCAA